MNYDMDKSGERIHQLRTKKGYTQEEVAQALNIDRSFYGRIEAGKKGCSIDFLIRIADFFDVSLDYLILGKVPSVILHSENSEELKASITKLIEHLEVFLSKL